MAGFVDVLLRGLSLVAASLTLGGAAWLRWLELRLPEAGRGAGWVSTACFTAVGVLLLLYREG